MWFVMLNMQDGSIRPLSTADLTPRGENKVLLFSSASLASSNALKCRQAEKNGYAVYEHQTGIKKPG